MRMPWSARFREPIATPGGTRIKTLADARAYVLALPKGEQKKPHWETVAQTLIAESESKTDHTMLTDIALRQALAGGIDGSYKERPAKSLRKNRIIA
jgi:hypothetical protein